jgi:hypothetical protein
LFPFIFIGGSNEPAETDETEKISASGVFSPGSDILANSSTPFNSGNGHLLLTANALMSQFRGNTKTPSSLFAVSLIPKTLTQL